MEELFPILFALYILSAVLSAVVKKQRAGERRPGAGRPEQDQERRPTMLETLERRLQELLDEWEAAQGLPIPRPESKPAQEPAPVHRPAPVYKPEPEPVYRPVPEPVLEREPEPALQPLRRPAELLERPSLEPAPRPQTLLGASYRAAGPRRRPARGWRLSQADVKKGIVLAELIGPPRAWRPYVPPGRRYRTG